MSKIEVDENDYYSCPLLLQTHKQVGQCNCHEAGLATPSCPMLCMYLLYWSHLLPKLIFWPVVKSKQQILPTSLPFLLNWCSLVDTSLAVYTLLVIAQVVKSIQ